MSLPAYPRLSRLPLGWALGLLGGVMGIGSTAQAQESNGPALTLRPSSTLQEVIPDDVRKQSPTFIQSDHLSGQTDVRTVLEGNVMIRRGNILLKADKVDYDPVEDLAQARGNVTINRSGNVYQGPALDIHLDAFEGFFTQPSYQLLKNNAYGKAERIDFIDSAHTVLHKADFTTCPRKPGPSWMPDWFFKADKITLDTDRNVGIAEGASLIFKDVPILPVPSIDFPLTEERKSGFLPPTIGVDNIGGLEYTQPYYVNLAPNRDVTFFPTYWSRRGLRLGTEFRYLESQSAGAPFGGEARIDYMEKDLLRGERRWGLQYKHTGLIDPSYAGGTLGLNLNLNRVSDDNYWKDFSMVNSSGVQRLLSSDAGLTWTDGVFSTSLRAQKWQTLQDVADTSNRITPPFDRVPQFIARMQRSNVAGFDFSVQGDLTRFESNRDYECANSGLYNCAPNANRSVASLQLSRPFTNALGYVTPKMQVNSRSYQFDGGLPNNSFYDGHTGQTSASVTVPTFSLDSGMTFERKHRLFDRAWLQTLEPRAFYVYTPYRDQNYLPNYDSGSNSFNFASVFTENAFGGSDRISDSKLLTLGAISRLIDPETGAEGARFGFAQRLRMQDQRVVIPGDSTAKSGISDILAGATLNLSRTWALDSTVQYNPKTENYIRRMVGGRYSPGSYRVINAAYRSQNNDDGSASSRQIDIGWQWPLHDLWGGADESLGEGRGLGEGRWYSVARMNYSPLDKKVVESIIGFEYDAGCWISRVVAERLQVTDGLARQRLLFQLEFVGFSRLGTNALGSLRTNVPRYQPLRQNSMTPSRFGNYD
ncbi:LPS biosynthesis protein [Limnohabitans sp. JirII-29]|uniref:LPS-assembly protein LptD n=1 Tax=Limnohabitans sp. JirII-29 TaxID=1835756 RepID=UPI000DD293D8|nr:LPS-assembly protein LptD [Limnohabitans sp. JirII-29]PUE27767.1 LPS biosynthesis protein [Limnohabitans sp. JirII-29]